MGNDVIHDGRFNVAPIRHALDAQRMGFEILFSRLLPCGTITAAAGRSDFLRVERFVFLTELRTRRNERGASGMAAGRLWSGGHDITSFRA